MSEDFGTTGAEAGRRGGKRSLETMTPEARRERARKAQAAQAAKRAARQAVAEGCTESNQESTP
jgi:hypothetical protein